MSVILSLSLLLALFAGCASTSENPAAEVPSTKAPATEKPTEPTEAPAEESTAPTPAEEVYTIRFDLNATPDDTTDDETFSYEVSGYDENWQPTVTMEPSVLTVAKTENAYIASAIPAPVREGYAFAGWQTRPNVTEADLVNGVSPYLWLFGTQSNYGDAVSGQIDVFYTLQILMYTPVATAGCTENVSDVTVNGEAVETVIGLLPMLDGQPLGWINKGEYEIAEGYVVPSNIEAVSEVYGSYLPVEHLQDGIIWIQAE